MSGVRSVGVDLDDLFDPDIMGDGPTANGVRGPGNVPLRYAAIAYGSKRADVGILNAGVDVSNLWAAKGTAVYVIAGLHGKWLQAADQALTNQGTVTAQVSVAIRNDGTWNVYGGTSRGPYPQDPPESGTWLPAGASVSDYQVQIVVSAAGHSHVVTNTSAASYASLSATQTASASLPPLNAASATERSVSGDITIRLRRISTGAVSTNVLPLYLMTNGYT